MKQKIKKIKKKQINAIEYIGISKKYNKKTILNGLNMSVPKKSIFFIIGLNGAGKSTLLKSTMGLLSFEGRIEIRQKSNVRIGSVIETPCFYESLTGFENMKYHAIAIGCSDEEIYQAMTLVGLDPKSKKKVKQYSLGMKQRLGIARAILDSPELLVLDEPLNGLDPAGINEIKTLIKRLRNKGTTILISSHLIRETSELATDYAILHGGIIQVQFSNDNLSEYMQCIEIKSHKNSITDIAAKIQSQFSSIVVHFSNDNSIKILTLNHVNCSIDRIKRYVETTFSKSVEVSVIDIMLDEYFLLLIKE